ncbi:motility associated factor glycosyltransferase family protein [Pseudomonas akapageensis]|uniref:motility associated factor glycosyltransferase family protein n=1 Tax=Pseudomonas akapageensis TaxID=2609961 RepID=UPI00140E6192|nr:6-hydroxymethylpterin diphosphokinase MptE-like protein [Pseudomonas akapageensis]
MSEIFQRNAQLLRTRWPGLYQRLLGEDSSSLDVELIGTTLKVCGIQLSSRHDRGAEARFQAASLPPASALLHLYGTGLGDLQQVLLESSSLQCLCVHVLNGALFKLVLEVLDQSQWLADPRVELAWAGDSREIGLPYFALPAEIVLADEFNARIRDRLVSETHLSFNNRSFDSADPRLIALLNKSLDLLRSDRDVAELFDSRQGQDCFVIATGPSLETHFSALRNIREQAVRPYFICVDTAYRPLLEQGIRADLVVSVDHNIRPRHLPADASAETTLVYMPMLDTDVLASWRGPRHVGYSASPLYDAVREQIPRGSLFVGGSVIHPAVDLAVKMGMRQITLFGADFAFPMNKTHTGWSDGDLGPKLEKARHWVLDGHGQRVVTQLNFRGYLCELERYIAAHPQVRFLNTSRAGALIAGTTFASEFCQ